VRLALVPLLALAISGCGYRVSGRADLLPKNLHTIAVTSFTNNSTRYKLSDRLAADITREFITRTRYEIVADPEQADAVLSGAVIDYMAFPGIYNPDVGRSSTVQMNVHLNVTLTERATGAVLYSRQNFEVRERYEISPDESAYIEESDVALERLSRAAARAIVSGVLENF
jgi:hypothetical protein